MIWLSFKKWNTNYSSMFVWQRIYRHGYKWTPFIIAKPRYSEEITIHYGR